MSNATFLGHPRGLATLFFTEMFERFTYYGMRALLILFLTATAAKGGFGLPAETAGAIYGLYTGTVYLFSLPGGWIADRLLGQRQSVWYGGILITAGNFILAIPSTPPLFYFGLLVIVLGVGLLKPNISAIVGQMYEGEPGARRDAGFSLFYMGINVGAFVAPLIAGTLGEVIGYRWGFFSAGLAMLIGLVNYRFTGHHLGEAGKLPQQSSSRQRRRDWQLVMIVGGLLTLGAALLLSGAIGVNVIQAARALGTLMVAFAVAFFGYVLLFGGLDKTERGRVIVIALFFVLAALFWAGYEQAATTFNLFARDYTDRSALGSFFADGQHPTSWYQSIPPVLVIVLAPFFAWLWVALGRRNLDPSAPFKFGLGLLQLGLGFGVMIFAAKLVVSSGARVLPGWLLMTYLLHVMGELCLSPIGLSNVTKLSPPRYVGQMMGTWFLGAALGNLAAGLIGGHVGGGDVAAMPHQLLSMMLIGGGAGLVVILLSPVFKRLMGGIR